MGLRLMTTIRPMEAADLETARVRSARPGGWKG